MSAPLRGIGECKLDVVESMEEYFSQEYGDNGTCRPCQLAPLASLYLGALERANDSKAASDLSTAYDSGDILTIAKAMDTIKAVAGQGLRQELEKLDCFTQSYVADHEEEAN